MDFFQSSNSLYNALSACTRYLFTSTVDPDVLNPFMASQLIALNQHSGVDPFQVEQFVQCVLGKALLYTVGPDITDMRGSSLLCAGQDCCCEVKLYAVHHLFNSLQCEAVLFLDAQNAFNYLNHQPDFAEFPLGVSSFGYSWHHLLTYRGAMFYRW